MTKDEEIQYVFARALADAKDENRAATRKRVISFLVGFVGMSAVLGAGAVLFLVVL